MAATRPGLFRPLRHEIPDQPRWVLLDGSNAQFLGLAGLWVAFARCGSPCWPDAQPGQELRWCPLCRPWWTQVLHS